MARRRSYKLTAARKEALRKAQLVSAQKRKGMSSSQRKRNVLMHGYSKLQFKMRKTMGAQRLKIATAAHKLWSKAGSMNP